MDEQMDHRAAIEFCRAWERLVSAEERNLARCHLSAVKAAWPGVLDDLHTAGRNQDGLWCVDLPPCCARWARKANNFERDYPGLKVDEPWLVTVMEGVK